jgi:hypothetical protein
MIRGAWIRGRALLALALAACGGDSAGPDSGALAITVTGLPGGTPANVSVVGPGGFSQAIIGGVTLTDLAPGSYTVTGSPVSAAGEVYTASPASQAVTVSGGGTAASTVSYGPSSGGLTVAISGLPIGVSAAVDISGPSGYTNHLTAGATLSGLLPGQYTLTAQPVADGSTQYVGAPATQSATVSTGGTASASVAYSESTSSGTNLRIDGLYLTQAVQTYDRDVPLIADRDAFLRVFVTASEASVPSPNVRVWLYNGGVLASDQTLTRAGTTPLAPQEGTLGSSWNVAVPRALVTPNLSILVDVDPDNLVAETNETDNTFPASGTPLPLQVEAASTFRVTLVPVTTAVDGRTGNVTAGNKNQFLDATMRMHPLSAFDATVGAPLTVAASVPALESNNGNNSWNTILSQVQARRVSDGNTRYYFGVVNPSYSSGVAGMGYIGFPVAIGWDKLPSGASVAAHEWGHNWARQHAPCGSAANPDMNFPYTGGTIGVFGYDVAAGVLKPTTSHDLMGYCNNEWISDYTYNAVRQYRSSEAVTMASLSQAIQPTLVVWGRFENGRPVLEPAFQATTRPSLPRRAGPYRVEARAGDGSTIFALDFSPLEVADDPQGGQQFAFAVPVTPDQNARISRLRLMGAGGVAEVSREGDVAARVEVRRSGPGRVSLRWDPKRAPMVVVRDPRTGQILSFARGGRSEVVTDAAELSVGVSDRVQSREKRVRVNP